MKQTTVRSNLIKGKSVIGLNVVAVDRGEILEQVQQIMYDSSNHEVKGIVLTQGGWFSDAQVVLFEDIQKIGRDAILVASADVTRRPNDLPEHVQQIIEGDADLSKNKVITEDGADVGKITDIYFDGDTGKVVELEVSQGMLRNAASGIRRVKVADIIKMGEDATIVKGYVEQELEEQSRQEGMKGAWYKAKDRAPGMMDEARQRVGDVADRTRTKASELTDRTREKSEELAQRAQDRANSMRNDPANRARMEDVKGRAQDAASRSQDALSSIGSTLKQTVSGKMQDMAEQRKKSVTGKYVTVNILGEHDEILAKRGDMITNDLLHKAEMAGVLDQVLSNTSNEPVDISASLA